MTDKEKIKKLLVVMANSDWCDNAAKRYINNTVLPFIDSLPGEQKDNLEHQIDENPILISETEGHIQGISIDSTRGIWINLDLYQINGDVFESFSAEMPVDIKRLNGLDLYKDLNRKRIKVTVETV